MTTLSPLLEGPLAEAIGRALIHLIWQASLVALALAGSLVAMRRSSANARYAVSCAALALTIVLPLATGVLSFRVDARDRSVSLPPITDAALTTPVEFKASEPATSALLGDARSTLASIPLDPALPWVVGFWLAGVTLLSARIALALVSARRLAGSGIETIPREWRASLARLADAMGIDRAVRILESSRVDVPTVVGWFSPVILVPASALSGLTPQQLETVLAHELAHIRRHDFIVNFLQTLVETLLFYHPAVWWISNRVRVEREHCCDDAAVNLCGDAVGYARALATLEERRAARVPSPALAATGGSLLERVRRLVGLADDDLGSTRPLAALMVLMIVSAAIAIPLSARDSRAGKASSTTIVVDGARDDDRPSEVTGVWTDTELPGFALGLIAGDTPEPDPFEELYDASELAAAVIERQHAELEQQLAEVEHQRVEIQQAIEEALAERDSLEWRIAMALAPAPPALPAPHATPSPVVAPRAPRGWPNLPPIAPIAPTPAVSPATPTPPAAPFAPMPYPIPTPRLSLAPRALEGSGRPVDPDHPSVDDMIILHSAGVDAKYVAELERAGLGKLSARQYGMLRSVGVDGDYVRELRAAGLEPLDATTLYQLKATGVDGDWLKEIRAAGYRSFGASALAGLHAVGVDGEYLRELEAAGFTGLSAEQLMRLYAAGIDADELKEWKAAKAK